MSLPVKNISWPRFESVVPELGGPGGPLAPPIFCRSVNPIWTGEGRLSPPITTSPSNVFDLPAALGIIWRWNQWNFEFDLKTWLVVSEFVNCYRKSDKCFDEESINYWAEVQLVLVSISENLRIQNHNKRKSLFYR